MHNRICKITATGVVTTLAGEGSADFLDGEGISAKFYFPSGVAVDKNGNVYVADRGNYRIRKITASGYVSTLAGDGSHTWLDATGTLASFDGPWDVSVDLGGNVYVADTYNNIIRKIIQ